MNELLAIKRVQTLFDSNRFHRAVAPLFDIWIQCWRGRSILEEPPYWPKHRVAAKFAELFQKLAKR